MTIIKLTYDPRIGLVQNKGGSPGLFLGNVPISYAHSLEMVANESDDYSINKESFVIVDASDGDVIVTLPTIKTGRHVSVKKTDPTSNTVTIVPQSSETIDGGENVIITTQWTSVTVQAIDGNWYIR